jgi:CHASE2 domain-containing sensor protein
MLYHNFDIAIDERGIGGYPVRAESEYFGEARRTLLLDPDHPALLEALNRLEECQMDMATLVHFGTELYQYLFTGEIETIFQQSFGHAQATRDTGLRIRLKIWPPEIAALPWEAMYFPAKKCFMSSSMNSPLVRYLEIAGPIAELSVPLPLRMLVVIPNSVPPYPELDAATEIAHLDKALQDVKKQVHVHYLKGNVTLEQLLDELTERTCNCLHFIGHGEFIDDCGSLLFNTGEGGVDYVDEHRFATLFQNHPSMKLVVLNSCHGASISSTRSFSGLAPGLVVRGIPAVVAMKYAVDDLSAVLFAREFYRKLFRGWDTGRVDVAMVHARNRLSAEVHYARDYCTPVLYLRAREGVLFDAQSATVAGNIPWAKADLHRAKAVYDTYRENRAVTGSDAYNGEMGRLVQMEMRRRYGQISVAMVACVLFLFSWVGAFDLLGLDTLTEMYTMRLGEWIGATPLNENIVIVSTGEKVEKSWRGEQHVDLLDKLSQAGAKAVAFDMTFEDETAYDSAFVQAIKKAKARGTQTIAGVQRLDDGTRAKIAAEIEKAIPQALGNTCIGRKLGFSLFVPLVVVKKEENRLIPRFALSLLAYAAFTGVAIDFNPARDMENRQIHFSAPDGDSFSMNFAEMVHTQEKSWCGLIADGDSVGNMLYAPVPAAALRDPNRRFDYAAILAMPPAELVNFVGGRLVLVGGEHDDVFSERRGWFKERRYGVEYHAEAVNTLLNGSSVQYPDTTLPVLLMAVLGFAGSYIRGGFSARSGYTRLIATAIVLLLTLGCTLFLYAAYYLLLNILYPVGAFAISYLLTGRIDKRILT